MPLLHGRGGRGADAVDGGGVMGESLGNEAAGREPPSLEGALKVSLLVPKPICALMGIVYE
jgi:hypothetical protein